MKSGDTISRYRITGPLGKGGMGVVYEAEDLRLGRPVALKFLPEDALGDAEKKRFLNEARAAAQVRHPNICPIYDIEDVDGRCFIAMALIDGETLAKRIKRGPMEMAEVVEIGRQIAAGLEAAHAAGIVHRDVKSNNVMLDGNGHVSVLDFGLALRGGDERLTMGGRAVGTPAYMSPEQARGDDVDARTDIWALGVVLFEMAMGRLPRRDATDLELPDGLAQVVLKAIAVSPKDRWQSAKELGAALARLEWGSETRTLVALPAIAKKPRWAAVLLGLAVVVALGLAGWSYLRLRDKETARPNAAVSAARRVAVLPLKASGEQAQVVGDALMEVWAEAIGNSQGKIWAVPVSEVRSRKLASAEEARRVYGVELAIGGTAETVGKDVKLTLKLTDTATLKQVGEQSYVYRLDRPLASRDGAVEAVLRLLSLPVTVGETPKQDAGAYAAYLEGRGLMARFDKSGNLDRAIESFKKAVAQDQNFALGYAALGEAYSMKASRSAADPALLALALENARRASVLDPNLAVAHVKLGRVLGAVGKQQEGIAELKRALELSPGNAEAHLELADIYNNQGLFAEAERAYRASIEARPTNWLGYFSLALFFEDRGRLDEAKEALRQAGSFAPENETVHRGLGRIYRMEGRYEDSLREYQRALQLQPSARAYNSLGITYYYLHQYKKSVSALESAIDLDSQVHQYWGNLGISCHMSGEDKEKSVPALRRAVALAEKRLIATPRAFFAMADLAEYRARLGDAKGAMQEIERIPVGSRRPFAERIVVSYELSGRRDDAIAAMREYFNGAATLREIMDEPILEGLRGDKNFQRTVAELGKKQP